MFVAEGLEMIDEVEPLLIELMSVGTGDPQDVPLDDVNFVFRLFHSIKGSSGFLQYNTITELTHEAETMLDRIRNSTLALTGERIGLLVKTCDQLRVLLNAVADTLSDAGHEAGAQKLMAALSEACGGHVAEAGAEQEQDVPKQDGEAEGVAEEKAMSEAEKASAIVDDTLNEREETPEQKPPSAQSMISDDMMKLFIQDSEEMLDQAEHALLEIQRDPAATDEQVKTAFRALHTFKGNAGFMNFEDLVEISHKVEAVLHLIREGEMACEPSVVRVMLQMIDTFRQAVEDVAKGGDGRVAGRIGFVDLLDELLPQEGAKQKSAVKEHRPPVPKRPVKKPQPDSPARQTVAEDNLKGGRRSLQKNIRVSVDKLEHLNNLVGELVISEAMVTNNRDLRGLKLEHFSRAAHRLNLITSELQDLSMSLRMIPIDNTLKKLIRLTHDVSEKTGKKVDLTLLGTDTEVDRTVAELIADPLVHIVRNSVDHGIEDPEERRRLKKPEKGTVIVEAKHQSGEVWIVITDDGKGMDAEKIVEQAIERGMLTEQDAQRLNREEALELVFEPGFSTAAAVTDVSGRGVGMDVVKKNIEKLNGRVEVSSQVGHGTELTIRIPLTLAIINGMVIRLGEENYIIPLLSIKESFKPTSDMINTVTNKGETIYLRGELLPLFRLSRLFEIEDAVEDPAEGIVVVVESGGRKVGLLIDELLGQQQTVIKSLGETLRGIRGISGASIMSDGRVALIIDIDGVVRLALF
jgi:two-component system chemotaxis sensor kinase CheA